MSGAAPAAGGRERVHPRRAPAPAKRRLPWPWNDRGGRLSATKLAAFGLEVTPAVWIAVAFAMGWLGARPVLEANHQTGLLMVRFLLLTLAISPVRSLFNWPRLLLLRRQMGLTALYYGLAHVVLYAWDQDWVAAKVSSEILSRVYLEIGLVALVGMAVLGVTSTDRALRKLGAGWKRLHQCLYLIVALGVLHYFMQSKANVGEATLMAGLFVWVLGWRLLPMGVDREPLALLGLSLAACGGTAVLEYGWYALATRIDPVRPLLAELDLAYGPHPVGQVLLVCLSVTFAATVAWAAQRERLRDSVWFGVAAYAGAAGVVAALAFAFSLADDWLPDDWSFWQVAGLGVLAWAVLGALRGALPRRRMLLDGACAALLLTTLIAGAIV